MEDEKDLKNTAERETPLAEKVSGAVDEIKSDINAEKEAAVSAAEETADAAKDAVEGTVDAAKDAAADAADAAEDAVSDAADAVSEVDRAVAEAMAKRDAEDAEKKAKSRKRRNVVIAIVAAVVVLGGVVASGFVSTNENGGIQINSYSGWLPKLCNKYNHMGYIDSSGRTIGDVADQLGISVAEFLESYGLPADMPASTSEMSAFYNMPVDYYAQMYGITFDDIKEMLDLPDTTEDGTEINGDTPWGVAEGEVTVGKYIGLEDDPTALDELKETYGLGDDVTADTLWKEVRNIIDEQARKERIEDEKAAKSGTTDEEATDDTTTETEDTTDTEDTDTTDDTAADTSADTADDAAAEATTAPAE